MREIFKGIMLVSDVDGTLIDREEYLPSRNLDAIQRFVEGGGLFTLATGRSVESARRFAARLPVNAPAILYNGGMIYDFAADRLLWQRTLPREARAFVMEAAASMPDVGVEVSAGCRSCVVRDHEMIRGHLSFERIDPLLCTSVADTPPDWHRVLFCAPRARLIEVDAFCKAVGCEGSDFLLSGEHYYEMLPAGVSKGAALTELSGIVGIPIEKIYAVGDYYNDVELIRTAGVGATTETAPPAIRQIADLVVGSQRDGAVADVVAHIEERLSAAAAD